VVHIEGQIVGYRQLGKDGRFYVTTGRDFFVPPCPGMCASAVLTGRGSNQGQEKTGWIEGDGNQDKLKWSEYPTPVEERKGGILKREIPEDVSELLISRGPLLLGEFPCFIYFHFVSPITLF
jgi:hypothetical protein